MRFRLFAASALAALAILATGIRGSADITTLPAYTIVDLGTLGGETSEAFSLNDSGVTVGLSDRLSGPAHGFRYDGALPIEDLVGLGPSLYSEASGINAAGVIVGRGSPGSGNRVLVWNGGAAFVPAPFASINSFGYAINDANTIVGNFALPTLFRPQAMMHTLGSATFTDIGALLAPLGGTMSVAVDVNASNVATGWMGINFVVPTRAFRFTPPAQVELLPTFGLYDDVPAAINDDGLIVGRCGVGPGAQHACFWSGAAAPVDINPAEAEVSTARGVNNKGEMVGIYVPTLAGGIGYAFLRTNGQTLTLDDLLPPGSGWQLVNAYAINRHSQIAGAGWKDGLYHAFLLTPTTMPGAGVVATPIEAATGSTPVKLTFDQITQGGVSTVTAASAGPPPPAGFSVGAPAIYYEISTSASFTGLVEVCIDVTGVDFGGTTPELFHYESGSWVAVPSTFDPAASTVCGSVASLSPFAVFRRQVAAYRIHELYDTTRAARRGSTVPIKFEVRDALGRNVSSPDLVVTALRTEQVSTEAPGEVMDSGQSNPDAAFRYDASLGAGGGYIFNLSTSGRESGTHVLVFTIGGSPVEYSIRFQVK